MAISTGAAIIGGAVIGGASSHLGASKAADAAKDAASTSAGIQRYQYDTTREDFRPYREVGTGALSALADIYGLARPQTSAPAQQGAGVDLPRSMFPRGPVGTVQWRQANQERASATPATTATPATDRPVDRAGGFYESPGYIFRQTEGQKAIERGAAARGRLFSGGTLKRTTDYAQGVASQEWDNWLAGLRSLAGVGQTATGSTASAGANAANVMSGDAMQSGAQRGSAFMSGVAGVNNAVQGGLGNWVLYNALEKDG